MINKVIYHDNCPDGFASAYISWKYLGGNAKYIPMKYGVWEEDAVEDGDSVLLLDISFQPEQLMEWYDRAESIVLLDHHESIASELTKMPFETVIDFDECGASLAHHYFAPDKPTPTLVSYIRDRDLWRWELPYSREVSAYIASYPFDVEIWGQIEWTMDTTFSLVVSEGAAILRGHNEMVERLVEGAYVNRFLGFEVPMVNSAILQSEIGNRLLELHGEASFAVVYNVLRNGMKKYSLRGRIGGIDLGQLAKEHGGGGHPRAAGLTLS